jgi:hypothetical protein
MIPTARCTRKEYGGRIEEVNSRDNRNPARNHFDLREVELDLRAAIGFYLSNTMNGPLSQRIGGTGFAALAVSRLVAQFK